MKSIKKKSVCLNWVKAKYLKKSAVLHFLLFPTIPPLAKIIRCDSPFKKNIKKLCVYVDYMVSISAYLEVNETSTRFYNMKPTYCRTMSLTHSVSFWKTVQNGEDELGVPVRVVGEEDTHGVNQHLIEAGGEHRLR
jgi:hypothetical protein